MISEVRLEKSTFREVPARFEAGTPPIAEAIALGATCAWLAEQPRDLLGGLCNPLARTRHTKSLAQSRACGFWGLLRTLQINCRLCLLL